MLQALLLALNIAAPVAIEESSVDLSRSTIWIEEEAGQALATPEEALQKFALGPVQGPSPRGPNLGFNKKPIWFLTEVKNLMSETAFVLSFPYPGLDFIDVYQVDASGLKRFPQLGDRVPAGQRSFSSRLSNVKLTLPSQSEQWILYRVETDSAVQAGASLQTEAAFIEQQTYENALLWSIYGMIAIMAAFHLFIWISMRQALYAYYSVYLAFTVLAQMGISGHYMSSMLGEKADFSNTHVLWAGFAFIALYEFTIDFLDIRNSKRKTYIILRFLQIYIVACYLIWMFLSFYSYLKIATATQIIHPLALLTIGILALKSGKKEARFFVLAFSVFMLGVMLFMAKQAGLISPSLLIQFSIPVTSVLQVTLMALALGDKMQLLEAKSRRLEKEQKEADAKHRDEILKLNASLEQRVEEQTRDIKSMLENTKVGLFSVNQNLAIHKDYARFLEVILETSDIAGKSFAELLVQKLNFGPDEKSKILSAIEYSIGEEEMFFEANLSNLPREGSLVLSESRQKFIDLDWSPVLKKDGTVEKVLVGLRDVTETLKLRKQSEEQQRDLRYMAEVINLGPLRFERFQELANETWDKIRIILTRNAASRTLSQEDMRQIYLGLHTIKGTSRMLRLSEITNRIHEAEEITSGQLSPKKNPFVCLSEAIEQIEASQQRYAKAVKPLLRIHAELLAQQKLAEMGPSLMALTHEAQGMIHEMAQIIGKDNCRVVIEFDSDRKVTPSFYQAMTSCLIHLVRNSLDHGIESPQERREAGKPDAGVIRFWIDERGRFAMGDDGRGLSLKRLEQKAKESNIEFSSEAELAELIFKTGLSTKDQVDQISGRGVGMDAVRTFLREAGSEIHIVKLKQVGEFMTFYFAIDIPAVPAETRERLAV